LLVACDPILLHQSVQIMTETLAALLAIVTVWLLTRFTRRVSPFDVLVSGGAMGLCVLCRPTFLVWLMIAAVVVVLAQVTWSRRAINLAAFVAGAAVVLAPWVVRNQIQLGKPILTTTHGGYTLLLGNNPSFYRYVREGGWTSTWDTTDFEFRKLLDLYSPYLEPRSRYVLGQPIWYSGRELRIDRENYQEAFENIRAEPGSFLRACAFRVRRLWGILPFRTAEDESAMRRWLRYGVAVWYAGVFVLAGVGVYGLGRRLWRTPWLWGVLLCLSFTAVHTFYWTDLRMRAPLMPFVAIVAAAGLAWLLAGKQRRKTLYASDFDQAATGAETRS
jgi:hypothetical protein